MRLPRNSMRLARAERWYCPDVGEPVSLRGTHAICAAEHGCVRPRIHCPLFLHFFIKTTAFHLRLGT